jgi:hypothetical protein
LSYPVSVGDILDRALKKADMYESGFIDSANGEQMDLLNEAYCELYDLLVTRFENYFVSEASITLTPNTTEYNLPTDFYKSVGVDYKIGATPTQFVTLKPFMENERNGMIGTVGTIPAGEIRIRYVPSPFKYTDRAELVQGISGWETLMVILLAISFKEKEESDTGPLERQLARQMQRIEEASQNRDAGMPHHITDIYQIDMYQQYASLRYQFSGDKIKLLSTEIISAYFVGLY